MDKLNNYNKTMDFARQNKNTGLFLQAATDDYVAARIVFCNGLINARYISAQHASEKILKTYIH